MPPALIRIGEHTSAEQVTTWPLPPSEGVRFFLTKASSFEAASEGVALSYLAGALESSSSIEVVCDFARPEGLADFQSTIFCSIFGFALIRGATEIRFLGSEANALQEFRVITGQLYEDQKGVLGLGNDIHLIAFDPRRRVPKALLARAQTIDKDGLPLPSVFQQEMVTILSRLGLGEVASQSTLPVLIAFIYELFLNTVQHGLPNSEHVRACSTRGIALSKITFSKSQLSGRRASAALKGYLDRIGDMQAKESSLLVLCISVLDMGDGIQNTLPARVGETDVDRVIRAFAVGESRKLPSSIERGLGLNKVLDAAFRLGARLQITSAGRRFVKDFSLGEDRFPTLANCESGFLPPHFKTGTSIDMFVPNLLTNIDQRTLPL